MEDIFNAGDAAIFMLIGGCLGFMFAMAMMEKHYRNLKRMQDECEDMVAKLIHARKQYDLWRREDHGGSA